MITTHLGDIELGLYGARCYLDRRGRPYYPGDLRDHDLIGYDRGDAILRGMREMGFAADRNWFALRCDDHNALWALVRAGCGLGFGQVQIGAAEPLVERVLPGLALPFLPVWLTAPEATRRVPRIRRVWDLLAAELRAYLRAPGGAVLDPSQPRE